ncbi:hypothetical protein [Hyella patelloides]|nr:hypothetical protein [Hyella patelloides]
MSEGEWHYYKICLNCQQLIDYLYETQDCYCFVHGELMESIRDSGLENEDCLIPLSEGLDNNLTLMDTKVAEEDENRYEGLHNAFYADFYRLKPIK